MVGIVDYAVVHRSLRPLTEAEQNAAVITAGQLDRLVPERDTKTDMDRLSLVINGMLTQIQETLAPSKSFVETARGFRGQDSAVHH